jgi:hypothetical protein
MDKLTQDLQTSAATAHLDVAPNAISKWAAPAYRVFKREDLKWFGKSCKTSIVKRLNDSIE